ncbi:hypothetical protein STEG23_015645 [Scotinomys teguina]
MYLLQPSESRPCLTPGQSSGDDTGPVRAGYFPTAVTGLNGSWEPNQFPQSRQKPSWKAGSRLRGMARSHHGDATLPSFLVTFIFLQLLPSGNGKSDFRVLGPPDPLLAIVGQDRELPCKLSPNISAEGMELRWYRDHPSPAVHVHKNGEDVYEEQMVDYRGRTTFIGNHKVRGEVAVRIRNVTMFDNGTYHCVFKEHTSQSQATLWLKVAGLGSSPRIRVTDTRDKSIRAECTSAGWFPEPKVEWLDLRGQPVPAETHFSASASTGLLAVVSTVTPQDRAVEGLTCCISNPLLPEKKVAETYLPAPLLRRSVSTEKGPALPLILTALGLVTAAIACAFGRSHKEEDKSEEEEADPAAGAEAEPSHANLSLDPETGSPKLMVSEDGKSVKRLLFDQDLSPNSKRFDQDPCILARERFDAGRHYWEVEPFFCLWTHDPRPLTICSVVRETEEDTESSAGGS